MRRASMPLLNPFLLWTDLALKTGEMMLSSGQVIGQRVDRMARAGVCPSARDRKEFALMGSEKLKAASASGAAVAGQLQKANLQLAARAWEQSFATLNAMGSLGASRTWGQAVARQQALLGAITRSSTSHAQLSGDTARLLHAALAPVHAASTANARRLGKARRRTTP